MKNILIGLNFVLVVALGGYTIWKESTSRQGYILNQKVFDGFEGKKELALELQQLETQHKAWVDSVLTVPGDNQAMINARAEAFRAHVASLSERYTSDIWNRINTYVSAYGREHGYAYIFGASGEGNIMYAGESEDITEDVVKYINERYRAGD